MTRHGGGNNRRERLIEVRDMERKKRKKNLTKKTKFCLFFLQNTLKR